MLKAVAFSLWATVATVLVAWTQMPSGNPAGDTKETVSLQSSHTQTLSIALLKNDRVTGHFVTKIYYEIDPDATLEFGTPLNRVIEDTLYSVIYDLAPEVLNRLNDKRLMEIETKLRDRLNERTPPLPLSSVRFEDTQLLLRN